MNNWQYDYAIKLLQQGRESIEEILKEYKNDIIIDEESNEYIIDNINFDLEHLQGVSLNHWGINQIGNVYLMIF